MSVSRVVSVQVQSLPPTTNAARFHSLRVYLQCQYWLNKIIREMDPTAWGWTIRKENLFPIEMSQKPAPDFLLEIINCNCKSDCAGKLVSIALVDVENAGALIVLMHGQLHSQTFKMMNEHINSNSENIFLDQCRNIFIFYRKR